MATNSNFLVLAMCVLTKTILADDMKEVYGVVSGSAHLPCNITSPVAGDSARLVLWYRGDNPQPVYSFDARYSTVKHWSEDRNFGPRSYFRDSTEPAQLIISNIEMSDAGIYKCRIDFRKSQTTLFRVQLKIVEEPKKPLILDAEGSAVMGTIGPFRLRQALLLVCLVEGGNPAPKVVWWRDGVAWDNEGDPSTYEDVLQNTLVISELDRSFHGSSFECRAINNNVTDPPKASVSIIMEMPILEMTVSNLPDPIIADMEYDIICQVTGSQPPPKITWTLGDVQIPAGETRLTHGNNLTSSTILFTPKIKDQGKVLTCKADNNVFPSTNKSSLLNVYYLPIVHVEIVNSVDPAMIREGETVILKCLIQAHPWVYRILWYKDGEEIVASDRILMDEHQVILKDVTKNMSGQYVCSAANVEGDGFSRPLLITVNYKPYCVAPTIQYKKGDVNDVGTSQGHLENIDGIDLLCQVDAKPKAANYRWFFNSSETRFEIPSAESTMTFSNYKASDGEDRGQVLCWASNDLGEQSKPCVFHVVPLGTPHPPTKCEISNHTASTIEVTCQQGFNGGLQQHFIMEVFETVNNSQILVATNWTDDGEMSNGGNFTLGVWGLLPSSSYIISVKAANDRGESSSVFVGGNTVGPGTLLPLPVSTEETRLPMLIIIVGILVTLMIIGAVVTATLAIRNRRLKKLNDIDMIRSTGVTPSTDNDEREESEALMEVHGFEHSPTNSGSCGVNGSGTINRKVSFRDEDMCSACRRQRHLENGHSNGSLTPISPVLSFSGRRMGYPPVERAVVRTFSIEKMRPVCPVCNPGGDTPYPSDIPQRHDTNGVAVNGKDVEKRLLQTAADIVHHKWEEGGGLTRQDVKG